MPVGHVLQADCLASLADRGNAEWLCYWDSGSGNVRAEGSVPVGSESKPDVRFDDLARFVCALMDSAPLGVVVMRSPYRCVAANATALTQLGCPPERSGGLDSISLGFATTAAERGEFASAVQRAIAGQSVVLEADALPHLGGHPGPFRLHFMPFVENTERGIAVLFEDTLQRHLAAEAFQTAEQRFRILVDAAADGIVIFREQVLLYVNSETVRLLGFQSPDDLVGRSIEELIEPNERLTFRRRLQEIASAHARCTVETVFMKQGGDCFPVECRLSHAEVDEEGTGVLFFRDITERRRQQLCREDAYRVEGLARLAFAIGAELENYATRLRRLVPSLRESPADPSGIESIASLTEEISLRARELAVLAPSNRREGEVTPLEQLLGRVCTVLTKHLDDRSLPGSGARGEILVDLEPVEFGVRGNSAVLERSLVSLAMTAWQSASLTLQLRIGGTVVPKSDVETHASYRLTLASGLCKTRSAMSAVGTPSLSSKTYPYGSWEQAKDLPLLAAFDAIRSQGGRVEIRRGESESVCFSVWLPLDPERPVGSLAVSAAGSPVLDSAIPEVGEVDNAPDTERSGAQLGAVAERGRQPILICDDEARLVALTAGLLREYGFEVLTAKTGNEALRIVTANPVDIVVLDVNLPGEDAAYIVGAIGTTSRAKVILSSGYTEEDVDPSLLKATIVKKFLSKPYSVDVLVRAIDAARMGGTP